ncbi:hypothetical protein quinque_011412 [Culex quinquefasciatus]|uniref:Uncharacterized protein n=1 Tax=Culex pipiens pipiens TaxID=38569 RepID=A0ABD1DJM1_CULPP
MSCPEQDNPLDVDISTDTTGNSTVDKFCRLCLEVQPDLLPLKARLGALPVPKMFALLTGLEIDFDDDYPKVACSQCFFRLEQAYQTRKDFLDNYRTLMSIVIAEGPEECPAENVVREEIVGDEDSDGISTIKEENLSDLKDVEIQEDCSEKLESPEDDDLDDDECVPYESIKDELYEQKITTRKKPKISIPKLSSPISIYEKKKHLRKVWRMDPKKCYICGQLFTSPRELNIHLPQHVNMLPYTCQLCVNGNGPQKELITGLKPLLTHFRQHSGCTPCPKCPFRLFGKEALYNHIQIHHAHEGQKFVCETCGFVMPNKRAHYGHMLRHRYIEEGRFRCEQCDMKFGTNGRLQRHLLLHKEKEFRCQFCPKTFVSNTLLLTHERTHSGGQPSICGTCGEKFTNPTKRWQHAMEAHPEVVQANREAGHYPKHQPKSLICEHAGCGYEAPHYQAFWYHVQCHELRYACEQCPKRFPTSQGLKSHRTVHTGERAFPCEQCGKRYSQMVALTKHQQTAHSTATPHTCAECGESFSHRSRLNNHMLKHSEPQHHCEYCNRMFRYKGDWTRHMKQHEEEERNVG